MRDSIEHLTVIGRTLALIKAVGLAGNEGARVSSLARKTGLPKSTVHRLLCELRDGGWIEQDAGTKSYFLGFQARLIGELSRRRHRLPEIAGPCIARIAERTGQATSLLIREGFDGVCVGKVEVRTPVRALYLTVGSAVPLGMGAGSTALMIDFTEDELRETLEYNLRRSASTLVYNRERIAAAVAEARRCGYAFQDSQFIKGMGGIGLGVRGAGGEIVCGIAIAFVLDWFDQDGRQRLVTAMRDEVGRLERRLAGDDLTLKSA